MAETIGQLVKRLRDARGLNQSQLAEYAKVTRPWLSRVEIDSIKKPERDRLERVARILNVPPEALWSVAGHRVRPQPMPSPRTPEQILRELEVSIAAAREDAPILVPEVQIEASAGSGIVAEEGVDYWPYHKSPEERAHSIVVVAIRGTCMEPEIHPGQRVYVDKDESPRAGDIVVAIHEGEVIIRRLLGTNGDRRLVANKDHDPVKITDRTHIFGVVKLIVQRPERRLA